MKNWNATNWKTTACGLLAALAAYVAGHPADFAPFVVQIAALLQTAATAALGYFAADKPKPAA